ncbi:MAG TPA: PAS domain S-box protein [Bacteroidota bacterium]|nr:PAS domain S-box protein [Bacteroidota bacterium]
MNVVELEIFSLYKSALLDYLNGGGEHALRWAYEFGRRALAKEIRSIDLIASHQETLEELLANVSSKEESVRLTQSATYFLMESLSSFEMTFRGYREAIATLQQSEERYRRLIDTARDVIYTLTTEGIIKSLNPVFETITGWARTDWIGKPFMPLIHPDDLPLALGIHSFVLSGQTPPVFDLRICAFDGGYRVTEITTVPEIYQGKVIGTFGIARDITERKETQDQLKKLAKRVLDAQEEERRRLARELHDDLCQWLSGMKLTIGMVEESVSADKKSSAKLRKIKDQINDRIVEVRSLSTLLRPPALDDFGISVAMERYCDDYSKIYELQISFDKDGTDRVHYPTEIEIAFYRILQEALSNVVKHSHAHAVLVSLKEKGSSLGLEISDDGIGIPSEPVKQKPTNGHGFGLISMRERAELLGGTFHLVSTAGKGTMIHIDIPLPSNDI